ncbi:cathelicidin-2-like [Ambystoma mexicanum]|uniref:cathelicidin-2-like n=1 Tax=Ambystoma mexicanum TaxID=8296 RepID=UPI0037E814C8
MQVWLPLLAVLAVSTTATFASHPHISWSIKDAPDLYNMGSNSDYIFKLVEGDKEYVSAESTRPRQLWFMMRETECLKSEKKQLDECDFKESAVMKACSAVFLLDPERNAIVINCDSPSPKRTRSRMAKCPPKCRRPGSGSPIGRF